MQYSNLPTNKFSAAFANAAGGGYITVPIPNAPTGTGRASFSEGFPPLDFTPLGGGGSPPYGQDFNGILNMISAWTVWQCAGGMTKYDSTYSTAVGGYPKGALLLSSVSANLLWLNTVDNNTTDPDGGSPANWSPISAGTVLFPDGTAALPGAAFATQTNMGLYKISSSSFGVSVSGALRVTFANNGITSTVPYFAPDGTAAAPSVSFASDPNTGIYSHGADLIGLTTAGVVRVTIGTSINSAVPYYAPNGSAATPSFAFGSATTGFWSSGAGEVDVALSGVNYFSFTSSAFTAVTPVRASVGTQALPGFAFGTDTDTGIWSNGANRIDFSCGNTNVVTFTTGAASIVVQIQGADGSASLPQYGFANDTNTGMYRLTNDTIGWSVGGVLKMSLDPSGNVDIGGNLEVTSTISEQGTLLVNKYVSKSSRFVGAAQNISGVNTMNTFAHGLGAAPTSFEAYLVCITNDSAVSAVAGDRRRIQEQAGGNSQQVMADATNVYVRFGSGGLTMSNWIAGLGAASFTAANWQVYVIARIEP